MVLAKSTPLLRKSGHEVYTPTLTGLGEKSHLVSKDTDLYTHIRDIIQVFEYEDLNVAQVPHRIKHLVYLDGYVPEDAKNAFDLIPGLNL
jgi:hypothetical protein